MDAVKPGVTTSEFWKSAAAALIGLVLIALGIYKGNDALVQTGTVLLGGVVAVYTVARSVVKTSSAATSETDAAETVAGK